MKNLSPGPVYAALQCPVKRFSFFRRCLPEHLTILAVSLICLTALLSCGTVSVYNEPAGPVFHSGAESQPLAVQPDSLNVLSFNIRKAEKIELATTELQELQKAKNIDVYLLQEMDEKGVKTIAKSLGLTYLYIPIVHNKSDQKDVGNAILARGAITCAEKLFLPHAKPLSKSRRLVTVAEVTVHQEKILVYSVHTETAVMSRKKRMDQVDAILSHAGMQVPNYKYVLIGGDFNTLFTKSSEMAVKKFRDKGFDWPTATVGTTATAFFGLIKPRHDYIFSKGLKVLHATKVETSRSSDHFPIMASFSMKP